MPSQPVDAYHELLGIPPAEQPPTYYRLLGLSPFESNLTVIERAADRQMKHLHEFKTGPHAVASQKLLTEIAKARRILLTDVERAAYDATLRNKQQSAAGTTGSGNLQPILPKAVAIPDPPTQPPGPATPIPNPLQATAPVFPNISTTIIHRQKSSSGSIAIISIAVAAAAAVVVSFIVWNRSNTKETVVENPTGEAQPTVQPGNPSSPRVVPPQPAPAAGPPSPSVEQPKASPDIAARDPSADPMPTSAQPAATKTDPPTSDAEDPNSTAPNLGDSDAAPVTETPPAELPTIDRAELRKQIDSAKEALREHPSFKKYYEHLEARPSAIRENGPKLALIIWTEASSNRTIADHPPSFVAAMEEVQRLAVEGGEFRSALQAVDARRDLGAVGFSPREATEAKCEVLLMAAETAARPGARVESRDEVRTWIVDLLRQSIAEANIQPFSELLPAFSTLAKTTAERFATASSIVQLAEESLESNQSEIAGKLIAQADVILKPTVGKQRKEIADQADKLRQRHQFAEQAAAAQAQLAANPDDPAANSFVGLRLLEAGQWKVALTHLAKGKDPALKDLATATLTLSGSPEDKGALAERWLKAPELPGPQSSALARMLYQSALEDAKFTGIARASMEAKLEALGPGDVASLSDRDDPSASAAFSQQQESDLSSVKPIDAIARIRIPQDELNGTWSKNQDHLIISSSRDAKIQLPISLKNHSYEVQFDFVPGSERANLHLNLPVGDRSVTAVISGYQDSGGRTCLDNIYGRDTAGNPDTIHGRLFQGGKKHRCTVVVQLVGKDATIRVMADNRQVIDCTKPISAFWPHWYWHFASDDFLGIGVGDADIDFHAISLRVGPELSGLGQEEKLPVNKPVELLDKIALVDDVRRGHWLRTGKEIAAELSAGPHAYLAAPIDLLGCSYRVELDLTLEKGPGQLGVILPVESRSVVAFLNAWYGEGGYNYFDSVNHQEARHSPDAIQGLPLKAGQNHRCEYTVQLKGDSAKLTVAVDGKELYSYSGPIQVLQSRRDTRIRSASQLGLAVHASKIAFRSCKLTVLEGDAKLTRTRPTPPPWSPSLMRRKPTLLTALQPTTREVNYFGISEGTTDPRIDEERCRDYVYAHAPSKLTYDIPAGAKHFTAYAYNGQSAWARFVVKVDGKVYYDEASLAIDPIHIQLPPDSKQLELITDDLGDSSNDWSCWCYPAFR